MLELLCTGVSNIQENGRLFCFQFKISTYTIIVQNSIILCKSVNQHAIDWFEF